MLKTKNMLAVALEAARNNIYVFPCNPSNKRPLVKDWPNVATIDSAQIDCWWNQFPTAMIGAVTGEKSNLIVLDIDVEQEEDAYSKLLELEERFGNLTDTAIVRTPSGGLHLYYELPEGYDPKLFRNSASEIGKGIDIRANGGYVILAGSCNSAGVSYEVTSLQEVKNA